MEEMYRTTSGVGKCLKVPWLLWRYHPPSTSVCSLTWKLPEPDHFKNFLVQCKSLSHVRLCNPMDCSTPGFPVHHQLPELAQAHVHRAGDAIQHLILCHPLLLLPSITPSIRVFSNESVLCIRWPKYWSFSFSISISPSNEYSGLISFTIDWLDLLAVQGSKGLSGVFSNTTVQEHQFFSAQVSLQSNSHMHT